jgi:hypothetical protein
MGRFVEGCFDALETDRPVDAITELLTATVEKSDSLIKACQTPWGESWCSSEIRG